MARKSIKKQAEFGQPYQVYFWQGVRIFARKTPQGWQLIKFDFNLSPDFSPMVDSMTVKGEYLRGGRLWTSNEEMHKFLNKYTKHSVTKHPQQQQRGKFGAKRCAEVHAKPKSNSTQGM